MERLMRAAQNGEIAEIRDILEKNPRLAYAVDESSRSALHAAAYYGQTEAVDLLLAYSAPVDATDKNLETPLHCATHAGCVSTAYSLLANGADLYALDSSGVMPLQYVWQMGYDEVVRHFMAAESAQDMNARRGTAVHYSRDACAA